MILLEQQLRTEIITIVSRYADVECVMLFGSRARGDADPRSDIDLAIKAPKMPRAHWAQLVDQLEEELRTLLLIDIVKFEEASDDLRENIILEGEVLYERTKSKAKYS